MMQTECKPVSPLNLYLLRRRRQRLLLIAGGLCFFAAFAALIFYGLKDKAGFFRIPSEITAEDKISHRQLRLGGYVAEGSVRHDADARVRFEVTDFKHSETVYFQGILPDLFREKQGVIAEGHFDDKAVFAAERVLAKHDEYYVPKDVSDRIKTAEREAGYERAK